MIGFENIDMDQKTRFTGSRNIQGYGRHSKYNYTYFSKSRAGRILSMQAQIMHTESGKSDLKYFQYRIKWNEKAI